MRRLRAAAVRFAGFFRTSRREREMREEMEAHLAMQIEENLRLGMKPEQARREALVQSGGIAQAQEEYRRRAVLPWIETTVKDLIYGLRQMRRSPGFSTAVILLLALGIGANTALFSFLDGMLLRQLPVSDPTSLVVLKWHAKDNPPVKRRHSGESHTEDDKGYVSGNFPYTGYEFLRDNNAVLSSTFGFFTGERVTVVSSAGADLASVQFVSGGYFAALAMTPAQGRLIDAADDRPDAPRVAVLGFDYWQARFGKDPQVIGQRIVVNGTEFTVAGVTRPGFFGVDVASNPQVYFPLRSFQDLRVNAVRDKISMYRDDHWYWTQIMGRLRPGVSLAQAQAALSPQFSNWVAETMETAKEKSIAPEFYLANGSVGLDTQSFYYGKPLLLLFAMSAMILAIACANIASLLLARSEGRRREIAVRQGLGATRARLVRQLLTESLLLSVTGGIAGAILATQGVRALAWFLSNWRGDTQFRAYLDWKIFLFTLALGALTGLLFGSIPALQAAGSSLAPGIRQVRTGSRAEWSRRFMPGIGFRTVLVAMQIAMSLLLLAGAALFVRTLSKLQSVNLGFSQENLLLFTLNAKQAGYKDQALTQFYDTVTERVRSIPNVTDVSLSSYPFVSGSASGTGFLIRGNPTDISSAVMWVGPGFLSLMQIPVLLGREILAGDSATKPSVVVVNEAFASANFPNINPIGRTIVFTANDQPAEIVGVVRNTLLNSVKRPPGPIVYAPFSQHIYKMSEMTFVLRTTSDPMLAATDAQHIVATIDNRVPVWKIKTQAATVQQNIGQERLFAGLSTAFAVLALLIASAGLYATMAYGVSRRTNEIGIRMALGAGKGRVVGSVLRESLVAVILGIVLGVPAAWTAANLVKAFLFQTRPADTGSLFTALAVLLLSALIAAFVPAWRAASIEPSAALRHE